MTNRESQIECLQRLLEHNCTPAYGDLFRATFVRRNARRKENLHRVGWMQNAEGKLQRCPA